MTNMTPEEFEEHFYDNGDFQKFGKYTLTGDINFSPTNGQNTDVHHNIDLGHGLFKNFDIESLVFNGGLDLSHAIFEGNTNFATCDFPSGVMAMRPTFIGDIIFLFCKCTSFQFGDFLCHKAFTISLDC